MDLSGLQDLSWYDHYTYSLPPHGVHYIMSTPTPNAGSLYFFLNALVISILCVQLNLDVAFLQGYARSFDISKIRNELA